MRAAGALPIIAPNNLAEEAGHGQAAQHQCSGTDPATGKVPEDLDQQCAQMFDNVRRVITAAGGSPDDIVKMTVWITDRALRPVLNKHWVEMFPDPQSRPARHTVASGDFTPPMQIQCDLFAVLGDG